MLKKIFVSLLALASAGCVTVVNPPTTTPVPQQPSRQVINQLRQRVDVSVTNNCAPRLQLVYQDTTRATLAPGQTFTVYVQRGITTGEPKAAVEVKAYTTNGQYLGSAVREYYFPTNPQDSWRVPKEKWEVNYLDSYYGQSGGCHS